MGSEAISVYRSLDRLDHAPSKSTVRRWLEKVTGTEHSIARLGAHATETGHTLMQYGESVLVGGAMGAIQASRPEGLDYKKVPIDGAVAAIGAIAGVATANEASVGLRNAGAAAAAIFTFRKTDAFIKAKKTAGSATAHGEGDMGSDGDIGAEDPIIAAARNL